MQDVVGPHTRMEMRAAIPCSTTLAALINESWAAYSFGSLNSFRFSPIYGASNWMRSDCPSPLRPPTSSFDDFQSSTIRKFSSALGWQLSIQ